MVRRRVLLRVLVGGTGAAVLGAVCGATTGLPKASVRRYRIGALIQRVAQTQRTTSPRDEPDDAPREGQSNLFSGLKALRHATVDFVVLVVQLEDRASVRLNLSARTLRNGS